MQALKQSTATAILVGPVIDSAGNAVTSAVLADFNLTKNGTTATLTGATVAHSHNGHYTIALTTGNTDTLGRLTISVNNTAMAMVPYRYTVLAAAAFDTLVTNGTLASTTSGRTMAVDASGNIVLQDGSLTAAKIATDAITATKIASDAVVEIQAGLSTLDAAAVRTAIGLASANIDTQLAGISAKTTNLPSDPADQSLVEAAITAAIATVPTAAQNADAVWDEAMADHTGSTTYGGRIVRATNSNVSVQITGSNHISADVHAFQTDVIDATAFASSAVSEIQNGLATAAELAKVPKAGSTHRYTQVASDSNLKTADVSIGAVT